MEKETKQATAAEQKAATPRKKAGGRASGAKDDGLVGVVYTPRSLRSGTYARVPKGMAELLTRKGLAVVSKS